MSKQLSAPAQKFDLAALGGVTDQPSPPANTFNLEVLGGVVDQAPDSKNSGKSSDKDSSLGKGAARTLKSLGSGIVGGLADTITMPYNLAATMFNALKETQFAQSIDPASKAMLEGQGFYLGEPGSPDIPTIPSAVDAVDQGVDHLTDDYTKTPGDERSLHEGIKTVGSMLSFGGAAKSAVKFGAIAAGAALAKFGSTKVRDLAAGGMASSVTSHAIDKGQGMPAAFGEGIGAGVLTSTLMHPKHLKSLAKLPAKAAMQTLGLNPKNLKIDALEAANRLGIDLPASGATNTKTMALANQMVGGLPIAGDVIREKVKTASLQFQKAFKDMADSVGPLKNTAVEQHVNRLYNLARDTLPQQAAIVPHHTVAAIKSVKAKVKTAILSPSEKELLATLDTLGNNLMLDNKLALPLPVEMLVGTKRSLNNIIKWDKDEGTKNLLRSVQQATLKDIEAYGQTNVIWQKTFDAAERQFEKVAKRETLEKLLAGKIEDPITKEVAYIPLAKLLNERKYAKQLNQALGEQKFKKLRDFTMVAEAMAVAQKNTPNPSGFAIVGSVAALVTSIVVGDFTTPLKVIGGGAVLTELLTNKRFLNLATKFAKQPNEPLAKTLSVLVKEHTGMTSQALMTGLKDRGDE